MKYMKPIIKKLLSDQSKIEKAMSLGNDQEILTYLSAQGISKQEVIGCIEKHYETIYVDLKEVEVKPALFKGLNINILKNQHILPYIFDESNKLYCFAISNLSERDVINSIKISCQKNGYHVKIRFAFSFEIDRKFEGLDIHASEGTGTEKRSGKKADTESDTVKWVDSIIRKGIVMNASDIHFEPQEKGVQVRYRIDGLLAMKEKYDFETDYYQNLVARVKVIAGMDIAEKRRPQDGRIDGFLFKNKKYDIRVSSVVTIFGEKIVMRIFDKDSRIPSYSELGFTESEEQEIKTLLSSPYGIIYMAGATGSGKTTTLYTMIQTINSDRVNIYTIENPVEKSIPNVNQIQIDPLAGIDYPSTLKALLRQDPDVIVVGEIRDQETSELAIRASLTGHLVMATIHANNALETISRLYNMDIEPHLISAGSLGYISQRLARILCPHCKEKKVLEPHEKTWLEYIHNKYPETKGVSLEEVYKPKGCALCNDIGYKGRTAITEIIVVDNDLKELIAAKKPTNIICDKAREKGFVPLELNGFYKVASGITSIEEILRIM